MTHKIFLVVTLFFSATALSDTDPYLWLEEVQSERALDWVRKQNAETFAELKDSSLYDTLYEEAYVRSPAAERSYCRR